MDYGPTIAAAFGSPNEREIFQLRTIFSEMLKRSPQSAVQNKTHLLTGAPPPQQPGGDRIPNVYSTPSNARNGGGMYNYSDAASTGKIREQGGQDGRSVKSQGVYSTGPMERRSDELHQAVAGYYPTGRNSYW